MEKTREQWLNAALPELQSRVFGSEYIIPEKVKVSCGFPKAGGKSYKAIGQCWSPKASAESNHEIFISPTISESTRVLDILCHELVHAIVGTEAGHKGPFRKCAKAIGLTGKMTATTAGPELHQTLCAIVSDIGIYPHAALTPPESGIKKQIARMKKITCTDCGYTARVAQKWIDVGTPTCVCGGEFEIV